MSTATVTLTDFLLARIAEDEAWARFVVAGTEIPPEVVSDGCWDRSRVLAECEAKRRIVELHSQRTQTYTLTEHTSTVCATCTWGEGYSVGATERNSETYPCPTLRALAMVYADHEDYRDDWRLR